MTWVELMAEHEQLLIALASLAAVAAMGLAYALAVVRRGRRVGRPHHPEPRR